MVEVGRRCRNYIEEGFKWEKLGWKVAVPVFSMEVMVSNRLETSCFSETLSPA